MPKFSVIVPMHNCAKWVRKGLESIRNQEFKDFELICVLDACEDGSKRLAKMFGDKVLEVDNHRVGPTLNAGLEVAEGDYILFMDDDDWWLHEYAFNILDVATREHPELDVMFFSFIFRTKGIAHPMGNNGGPFPAVWNKVWKRSFIGDHRFGMRKHDSDLVFHNEMMQLKPKYGIINSILYYYNYREGSLTDQLQKGESRLDE